MFNFYRNSKCTKRARAGCYRGYALQILGVYMRDFADSLQIHITVVYVLFYYYLTAVRPGGCPI